MTFAALTLRTTRPGEARVFYDALGIEQPIVALPAAARAAGAPPHWLGALAVEDETAARLSLTQAGCNARGPTSFSDPFGAGFALTELTAAVPGLCRADHAGSDPAGAAVFYSRWDLQPQDLAHHFRLGHVEVSFWDAASRPGVHPHWLFSFGVPDLEQALASVEAGGGEVIDRPPAPGTPAPCHDPQGAIFGLVHRA